MGIYLDLGVEPQGDDSIHNSIVAPIRLAL